MTTHTPPARTESTTRIEAFSDGIFAVAITLLAIDLKAPVFHPVHDPNLLRAVLERWPEYLAVLNSFASVLLIWMTHHEVFKKVGRVDVPLMLANGLLLLLVVCIPYPTSTLARYLLTDAGHYAAAFAAGYSALVNVVFRLLWAVVCRGRLKPDVSAQTVRTYNRAMLAGIPTYCAIGLVAFVSPIGCMLLCNATWIYWSFASSKMHLED